MALNSFTAGAALPAADLNDNFTNLANGSEIAITNNTSLKSKDNAGTGTVDLIKATTGDKVQLPDGAELATSAAPTTDVQVANKKYVDDEIAGIESDSIEANMNGSNVTIKCKIFSASLSGSADESITHGLTASKIVSSTTAIYHPTANAWYSEEAYKTDGGTGGPGWKTKYDTSDFTIFDIGGIHSGQNYKVTLWYHE